MRILMSRRALPVALLLCAAIAAQAEEKEKKGKAPQVFPAAVLPFQERGPDSRGEGSKVTDLAPL